MADDACKLLRIEAVDGVGLVSYAGLGRTATKVEPSEWMSRAIRGRNLRLGQYFDALADAAREQVPRQLRTMSGGRGTLKIMFAALLKDGPRIYTIDLQSGRPGRVWFGAQRHANRELASGGYVEHRFKSIGSGDATLLRLVSKKGPVQSGFRERTRGLIRLIAAVEAGRVPPTVVAEELAAINQLVADNDPFVGPRCVVTWRILREGKIDDGHAMYTGREKDPDTHAIPTIMRGHDVKAIAELWTQGGIPQTARVSLRAGASFKEVDDRMREQFLEKLSQLPRTPDTRLR